MHVKGTRPPGALALPENLKADVYLPPAFVETNEDTHVDIAKMVQNFLETFGVHTVQRWTQFGRHTGCMGQYYATGYCKNTLKDHPLCQLYSTIHYTD